ncbi:MAG: ribosome biogenesis GTPase YlqF [Cellvibrio sp.]|nr:ribosome biogenesis GTPase YlqF [Cellvibrio sp.]
MINWFPGHMHKARKDIAEVMPQIDVVIEVIDARIPFSSENPLVPSLRGDKPLIKLFNKADLADPELTQIWIEKMEQESGVKAIAVSQERPEQIRALLPLCESLVPEKLRSIHPARAMIMGIPNVGKSTIINTLAGRTIAKTGNEAGITKSQQKIKLDNNVLLTDTPGFLWPKLTPPSCGFRLAITGAIKETVYDYGEIAFFAADYLYQFYPDTLKNRYQLETLPDNDQEIIEAIGIKRGCAGKGGRVDLQKASTLLINEIRAGLLGRITWETPSMVQDEIIKAEAEDLKKAEEKEARDRERKLKTKKNRR